MFNFNEADQQGNCILEPEVMVNLPHFSGQDLELEPVPAPDPVSPHPGPGRGFVRTNALDKNVPPNSPEMEKGLLSALFLVPGAFDNLEGLAPGDFWNRRHRLIFEAASLIHGRGEIPNVLLTAHELVKAGEDQDVIGQYLIRLADEEVPAVNVKRYAQTIKELSQKRKMINGLNAAMNAGFDNTIGLDKYHEIVQTALGEARSEISTGPLAPFSLDSLLHFSSDLKLEDIKDPKAIIDGRLFRGFITITIGSPGSGKSLYAQHEGLAVSCGVEITGAKIEESGAVWYHNTEDPIDESKRRLYAVKQHFDIKDKHAFIMTSGYSHPLIFAGLDERGRPVVHEDVVQEVIRVIKERNVILYIVDPVADCHHLNENDNSQISILVGIFRRIAEETGCAVHLVHHPSKNGGKTDGDMDSSRGASSLVGGGRVVHSLRPLTENEAKEYKINPEESRNYVRFVRAKCNLATATWQMDHFQKKGIRIPGLKYTVPIMERVSLFKDISPEEVTRRRVVYDIIDELLTLKAEVGENSITANSVAMHIEANHKKYGIDIKTRSGALKYFTKFFDKGAVSRAEKTIVLDSGCTPKCFKYEI